MESLIIDRSGRRDGATTSQRRLHSRHSDSEIIADWLESDIGADVHDAPRRSDFFRDIPLRLATIRLELRKLARTQGAAERGSCFTGLATDCQWIAGYARIAGFHALSQVAVTLEALTRELAVEPERLDDRLLRTLAHGADLLNSLANTAPFKAGRAEGARVLIVDEVGQSLAGLLASLEKYSVAGVGVASSQAALGLLNQNPLDLIVLRAEADETTAPRLCQAIRQLPGHAKTPILVLSAKADWETKAVFAMNGATEVSQEKMLPPELALKVMGHFFHARLTGACSRPSDQNGSL